MKAMSKQQLADLAGVSVRTLMSWCKPHAARLKKLGLKPNAKVLPPKVVKYIAEKFTIILDE